MPELPRKRPCASCPYRRDVPSGVWDTSEYELLRKFDGEIVDQAIAGATGVFLCHQADGHLCAGWVGHRDPLDLLAIRLALSAGSLDQEVCEYSTDVPLFSSGAEACEHGIAEVEYPSERARDMVSKLVRLPGIQK